jgi:hypothetical protein
MELENRLQEKIVKPKKMNLGWVSIGALILVLAGIGVYGYFNYWDVDQKENLGTYDNPEVAFKETQKALSILSTHLKIGIESVQYVKEYDNSKNLIFKQQKSK